MQPKPLQCPQCGKEMRPTPAPNLETQEAQGVGLWCTNKDCGYTTHDPEKVLEIQRKSKGT